MKETDIPKTIKKEVRDEIITMFDSLSEIMNENIDVKFNVGEFVTKKMEFMLTHGGLSHLTYYVGKYEAVMNRIRQTLKYEGVLLTYELIHNDEDDLEKIGMFSPTTTYILSPSIIAALKGNVPESIINSGRNLTIWTKNIWAYDEKTSDNGDFAFPTYCFANRADAERFIDTINLKIAKFISGDL